MKTSTLIAISAVGLSLVSNATVTLSLNVGGLENDSGVATDGMSFGILVDTNGNGFQAGSYLGFDLTFNGQFLSTNSGASDDWFVYGGSLGAGQTAPQTASVFPLGAGSVGTVSGIDFTNLTAGDEFGVMWFPSNIATSGSSYGFFTDTGSDMVVPPDTGTSTPPSGVSSKSVDFTAVPEPSSFAALAGLLAVVWVMNRRRRA